MHVEIAESYSTEAFLLALRRFMALHGAPKRFQSDQGTQLVAASKQVKAWDWSRVHQQADGVGAEWHVVPTGGQHFNGQAEWMIGIRKKFLEGALAGKRSTMGELGTIVAEAAQMVNSRPIARSTGDPESGGPITPLHLLLGRASVEVPQVHAEAHAEAAVRGGREEAVLEQVDESSLRGTDAVAQVDEDVLLLAEAENDDPTNRMGIVDSVKPGEDRHVRTVNIRYTNPGKTPGERSPPKITTRPIHKIAEASNQGGDAPAQPDPADQGIKRSEPGKKTKQEAGAKQAPSKAKEEATDKPGPVVVGKRGPGRPKKGAKPNADPRAAQPASGPEADERLR
jgi:hypothetical protein